MKTILWASDSANSIVGFGTVAREVLSRLSNEYVCLHLGFQYKGQPLRFQNFTILPNFAEVGRVTSLDTLTRYFKTFNIDLLITLSDPWTVSWLPKFTKPIWVGYFPIDGEYGDSPFKRLFSNCLPLAMSVFGAKVIQRQTHELPPFIYHGVDTELFKPLSKTAKENLRESLSERCKKDLTDKFIVGCVARNTERKRFDRLFAAFSKFAEDKRDVVLYLHSDPYDPFPSSQDILSLLRHFRIENKTIISPLQFNFYFGCPPDDMVKLYNVFDVHALSTAGEGFCLPLAEAMACSVPNIVTDWTACTELVEGRGWLVPVKTFYYYSRFNIRRGLCDIDEFAKALEEAYNDREHCKTLGKRGRDFAVTTLDWKTQIIPQWKRLLGTLLA